MTIADMILYLRQQLIALRSDNNRQVVAELLATFKMLTRAAYDSGDEDLVALLVDLTDSTRDLYMGKPLNGRFPSEDKIRAVAGKHAMTMTATTVTPAPMAEDTALLPRVEAEEVEAKALEIEDEHIPEIEDTQPLKAETIREAIKEAEKDRAKEREAIMTALTKLRQRDWHDHTAIRDGTPQQMRAYSTVYDELAVFLHLKEHKPMWAGSYPIHLDIPASDIDIIFSPPNLRRFINDVRAAYSEHDGFVVTWQPIKGVPSIVVRFLCNGFPVELFAQPRPVDRQDAYVHMLVEARLLIIGGEKARSVIRQLKQSGMGTELAFTSYFNIQGDDPYQAMLYLAQVSDEALVERFLN